MMNTSYQPDVLRRQTSEAGNMPLSMCMYCTSLPRLASDVIWKANLAWKKKKKTKIKKEQVLFWL